MSFAHYPARGPVSALAGRVSRSLQRVAAAVCSCRYSFSLAEVATLFTAFAESGVAHLRLFRLLLKEANDRWLLLSALTRRLAEATPRTALSLLYAYSRAVKQRLLPAGDRSLVCALNDVIDKGVAE